MSEEIEDDEGQETAENNAKNSKSRHAQIFLLFAVIIIEGYVVLSSELLAIRQTIPFVGSGTDTISIIIAAVLMPLAFGYYYGGRFKPGLRTKKNGKTKYLSVRKKLIKNIIIASIILLFGLSYSMLNSFFALLIEYVTTHRLLLTVIYSVIFLVYPVYLLGQTIPLVSNYFSKEKLAKVTGRMLFFSTLGSFMGAVFSTVLLMSTIGVHYTAVLNFFLLALLVAMLSKKKFSEAALFSYTVAIAALFLNSSSVMAQFNIVENNTYNTIQLIEHPPGSRHLKLNGSNSSFYSDAGKKYYYVEFLEKHVLGDIFFVEPPKKILVIGAGGFTFGLDDETNIFHFVDIDKSLRSVSEELLLKQKLTDNKEFFPMPARAFLTQTDEKYDVIFLDAYLGDLSFPEHLATVEFFQQVRDHLKDEGIMAANFIVSPTFRTRFSRHIDNTLRQVFPFVSRTPVQGNYRLWEEDANKASNVVYLYRHNLEENVDRVYTDNKNRVFFDKRQER